LPKHLSDRYAGRNGALETVSGSVGATKDPKQ
jgi:hypothetical protein